MSGLRAQSLAAGERGRTGAQILAMRRLLSDLLSEMVTPSKPGPAPPAGIAL